MKPILFLQNRPHAASLLITLLILSITGVLLISSFLWLSHHYQQQASIISIQCVELGIDSGFSHAKQLLEQATIGDQYLILKFPTDNTNLWSYQKGKSLQNWLPIALWSGPQSLPEQSQLQAPQDLTFLSQARPIETSTYRHFEASNLQIPSDLHWIEWNQATDSTELQFRYAFWIEDLQSRIDIWQHSQTITEHAAADFTELFLRNTNERWENLDLNTDIFQLPDHWIQSLNALTTLKPTIQETLYSRLQDFSVSALQPYAELSLIPQLEEFPFAGEGKLNLNHILHQIETQQLDPHQAVDQIATHIDINLPYFKERAGGFPFPEHGTDQQKQFTYLQALAANLLDYADQDSQPIIKEGFYRGVDATPIVSESFVGYHLHELNAQQIKWTITLYVELWNLSNHTLHGQYQGAFESFNPVRVGFEEIIPSAPQDDSSGGHTWMQDPQPEYDGTHWWLAPTEPITLQANEYRVITLGSVTFHYPLHLGEDVLAPESLEILTSNYSNRYRIRYRANDQHPFVLIDQPRGTVERAGVQLTRQRPIVHQSNNAAAAYGVDSGAIANLGDVRASFYLGDGDSPKGNSRYYQSHTSYTSGTSPNSRNLRANLTSNFVYKETRPSQWPDGGHQDPPGKSLQNAITRPDQPLAQPPQKPPAFVQYLNSSGQLRSISELGHLFDPHFWEPHNYDRTFATLSSFHDLGSHIKSLPSPHYCGGNTLRIGRPEHQRWRMDQRSHPDSTRPTNRAQSASALLDLFHCGSPNPLSSPNLTWIPAGTININTASAEVLQSILNPALKRDPRATPTTFSLQTTALVHDLIQQRPFTSPSQLADLVRLDAQQQKSDEPWFGNVSSYTNLAGSALSWNDTAREEHFARLYDISTVRSRNFRIHVIAQSYRRNRSGEIKVEAQRIRQFQVFINPERDTDGQWIQNHMKVIYVRSL